MIPELIITCFTDSGIGSSSILNVKSEDILLERFKEHCLVDIFLKGERIYKEKNPRGRRRKHHQEFSSRALI